MRPVLILRPSPGAEATARRAEALGLSSVVAPLFDVIPVAWDAPHPGQFDALLLTSANAPRLCGSARALYLHLSVYAVGSATAAAAHDAGFETVHISDSDGAAALDLALSHGHTRLLRLVGHDHIALAHPKATLTERIVYNATAHEKLPPNAVAALGNDAVALLHSPRAALLFARLLETADLDRGRIRIATLSQAIAQAAGEGWAAMAIALRPDDEALLAAAARLCEDKA